METVTGIVRKLKSIYHHPIEYYARIGDQEICLNAWIGQSIGLSYTGRIYCIQCGRKTSKSFQQGFCFPCFRRLQECHLCIIHPERCTVEQGTCPSGDWAHAHCDQSHIVYLANSSGLKVGITRKQQLITRWIDQGALQAIPLFSTVNRYRAGMVEVALKAYVADRTNWRLMLKNNVPFLDLIAARDDLYCRAECAIVSVRAQSTKNDIRNILCTEVTTLTYPVLKYPNAIQTISLEKESCFQGRLLGIKGQYLIFDVGVINIRKFSGYDVVWQFGVP